MTFKLKAIIFVMLLTAITGCATVYEVETRYYGNVELSNFRTYRWQDNNIHIYAKTSVDKILLDSRIRNAINRELKIKGYADAGRDPVSFVVAYRLDIRGKIKNLPAGGDFASLDEQAGGRLLIEINNPETGAHLWRGSADAQVYKYSFLSQKINTIERAIKDILRDIPDCR